MRWRALAFGGFDARAPVWVGVAAILWLIGRQELQELGRVSRKPHENSPATKFATFCLQRSGLNGVTVSAVPDQLNRRDWAA